MKFYTQAFLLVLAAGLAQNAFAGHQNGEDIFDVLEIMNDTGENVCVLWQPSTGDVYFDGARACLRTCKQGETMRLPAGTAWQRSRGKRQNPQVHVTISEHPFAKTHYTLKYKLHTFDGSPIIERGVLKDPIKVSELDENSTPESNTKRNQIGRPWLEIVKHIEKN